MQKLTSNINFRRMTSVYFKYLEGEKWMLSEVEEKASGFTFIKDSEFNDIRKTVDASSKLLNIIYH